MKEKGRYDKMLMRKDDEEVMNGDWEDGLYGEIKMKMEDWEKIMEEKKNGEKIMEILMKEKEKDMIEMV